MIQASEPQVDDRGHYGVNEASRRLGCNKRTLWAWAGKVGVVPRMNQLSGRVFFTGTQIKKIWKAAT